MSSKHERRTKLERLFDEIEAADDQTLRSVLARLGTDELSVVLGVFSIERARRVLSGITRDRISAAEALLRDGAKPPVKAAEQLVFALRNVQVPHPAHQPARSRPITA